MTDQPQAPRPSVSLPFILLSLVAALFLAAGIVGLVLPELAPLLARPPVAWSLIAVGVAIDGFALAVLLAGRADLAAP